MWMFLSICINLWDGDNSAKVFPSVIFSISACHNTFYLNMTFIFDWCRRTSAAVTPVRYECDSTNVSGIFPNGEIKERSWAWVTPIREFSPIACGWGLRTRLVFLLFKFISDIMKTYFITLMFLTMICVVLPDTWCHLINCCCSNSMLLNMNWPPWSECMQPWVDMQVCVRDRKRLWQRLVEEECLYQLFFTMYSQIYSGLKTTLLELW